MHTTPPLGSTRSDAPQASTPPPIAPLPRDQGLRALRQNARIDGPAALPRGHYALVTSQRFGDYVGRVRSVDAFGVRGVGLEALGGGVLHRMVMVNGAIVDAISTCTPAEAWEQQPNRPEATCNQDSQVPAEDDTPRFYVMRCTNRSENELDDLEFIGPFPEVEAAVYYEDYECPGSVWGTTQVVRLRPSTLSRPQTVIPATALNVAPAPAPTPDQTPDTPPSPIPVEFIDIPADAVANWAPWTPDDQRRPQFGLFRTWEGNFLVVWVRDPGIEIGGDLHYGARAVVDSIDRNDPAEEVFAAHGYQREFVSVQADDIIAFWETRPSLAEVLHQIEASGMGGTLLRYRVQPSPERAS